MKTTCFGFIGLSVLATASFAAAPVVDNISLNATGAKTVVTYDLSGVAGIVTMEIQTNTVADLSGEWVALDGCLVRNATGDVSCVVQPGSGRRIEWPTKDVLGDVVIKNARAKLTAWSTNAPPDWCIGDLTGADVARYYTSTNYFPLGFDSDVYKTSKIVYKRVRAKGKSFSMGQPTAIDSYSGGGVHPVTLTRDYYLAIYETTQAQYHYATGLKSPYNVSQWPTDKMYYDSKLPFLVGWWDNIRGGDFAANGYEDVSDSSFVAKARTKTGLLIDLPTEAEWEFAARCGGMRTKTQLVNGEDATLTNVAWIATNSGGDCQDVGLLLPNDWGFYDMIGNVAEWCVDPVTNTGSYTPLSLEGTEGFDPIGTAGLTSHVQRGATKSATYNFNATVRSTYGIGQAGWGFRTVAVIEKHDFTTEPDVDGVKMFQNSDTRTVKIGYNLTDTDKIVTLVVETNTVADASGDWVALPDEATSSVYGDVNRIVKAGEESKWIYWNPDETFADETIASGAARAVLTEWPTNSPPNYMVIDLSGNSIVRYYTSTNALPEGGLANSIYKSRYMVFRKIPAKDVIWLKGVDPTTDTVSGWDAGILSSNAAPYRVKLTYDYYIGIYELTRAQACILKGSKVSPYGWFNSNFSYTNSFPAGSCFFTDFAAATTNRLNQTQWYGDQYEFRILSDAEWEFACRAGEPKVLYSGDNFSLANLKKIGVAGESMTFSEVGTMPPNRWGLYDMLGNAREMCRDHMTGSCPEWLYWQTDAGYIANGYITDPEGPGVSVNRVVERGFGKNYLDWQINKGIGYSQVITSYGDQQGTRLTCPIPNGD